VKSDLDRAASPHLALAEAAAEGRVKMSPILAAIGINPTDPTHQAALLACDKYDLDPLLKHIVVIPKAGPYITRDGWLHVAHRSGQFDGMEVVDTSETQTHWIAKVAVYRKDMGRPFTYVGRYPKSGGNSKYGPEMAVKTAEVMALRRAFPVSGVGALEERWEKDEDAVVANAHRVAELAVAAIETQAEAGEVLDVELTDDEPTLDIE
jgi:hypothetical protein